MFYNDLITILTSLVNVGLGGMFYWILHHAIGERLRHYREEARDRIRYLEDIENSMMRSLERRIESLEDKAGIGTGSIVDKDDLATPEQNTGIVVNYNTPSEYTYQGGDVVGLINLPNRQTSPKLQDEGR